MRWITLLLLVSVAGADDVELGHDTGSRDGQQSCAGTGHVVAFRAPRPGLRVASVLVHGARYGGGYDPSATTCTVTICDERMRALHAFEAPYARFASGSFGWVELPVDAPVRAPRSFHVVVAFAPTATKGVYVGWSAVQRSHSGLGLPGGAMRPVDEGREWMIRVRLTSAKPQEAKPPERRDPAVYLKDFAFVKRTVQREFPALKKKDVDWGAVCDAWEPTFAACREDAEHARNIQRMLARLGDMHSGVVTPDVGSPAFEGLYGAGLWIAVDRGRILLRAMAANHPLADRLRPGAELLAVGGRPAGIALVETRRRLQEWSGWSSTHFLDARLSFQFFPFGEARHLSARFLDPEGGVVDVELERWGPGGRGLSRIEATMPDGIAADGRAVSGWLEEGLGYVRILGSMDGATQEAFFAAIDRLEGARAVLLDCRGMGGGSDDPAWAMAGRFFRRRTRQGRAPALEPTGSWQFDGPLVMLQDEREVSSAETFTWALAETGRADTVGRPTGGATIIPRSFTTPSGLVRFRLGYHDRETPVLRVRPEGVGTPPAVFVPYEPCLLARHPDPVRAVGVALLRERLAGKTRRQALAAATPAAACGLPEEAYREACVRWQHRLLTCTENLMPDVRGAREWLAALGAAMPAGLEGEEEAQAGLEALLAGPLPPPEKAREAYLAAHAGTRHAAALRAAYP